MSSFIVPIFSSSILSSCSKIYDSAFNITLSGDADLVDCTNYQATTHQDFVTDIIPLKQQSIIDVLSVKINNILIDPSLYKWNNTTLFVPGNLITSSTLCVDIHVRNLPGQQFEVEFNETTKHANLSNTTATIGKEFLTQIWLSPSYDIKDIKIKSDNESLVKDVDFSLKKHDYFYSLLVFSNVIKTNNLVINLVVAQAFQILSPHQTDVTWSNTKAWVGNDFQTSIYLNSEATDKVICNFQIKCGEQLLILHNDFYFDYRTSTLFVYGSSIKTNNLSIDFDILESEQAAVNVDFYDENYQQFFDPIDVITENPQIGKEYKFIIHVKNEYKYAIEKIGKFDILIDSQLIDYGYFFDSTTNTVTLHPEIVTSKNIIIKSHSILGKVYLKSDSEYISINKSVDDAGLPLSVRLTTENKPGYRFKSVQVKNKDGEELDSSQYHYDNQTKILTISDVSQLRSGQEFSLSPVFEPYSLSATFNKVGHFYFTLIDSGGTYDPSLEPELYVSNNPDFNNPIKCTLNQEYAISAGTTIYFKGDNPQGWTRNTESGLSDVPSHYAIKFIQGDIELHGNPMSLLDNGSASLLQIPSDYCFAGLFEENSSIKTPCDLPAETLTEGCYKQMFKGCDNLRHPSGQQNEWILPAKVAPKYCYSKMFSGDSSLEQSPLVCAKEVNYGSCEEMFFNCDHLSKVNLLYKRYWDVRDIDSFTNWLSGVSSTGTIGCFTSLPVVRGPSTIPENWIINSLAQSFFELMPWEEVIQTVNVDGIDGIKRKIGLHENESLIGFTKTVQINQLPHVVRVIDESIDTSTFQPSLTFEFVNLISDENGKALLFEWNKSWGNNVWDDDRGRSSQLKNTLNTTIFALLPSALRGVNVIKPILKKTSDGLGKTHVMEFIERLWLLSHSEIGAFNGDPGSVEEGDIYDCVYTQITSQETPSDQWIKTDLGGTSRNYWLRSPTTGDGCVSSVWYYDASLKYPCGFREVLYKEAIAPCFCI